MNKCSAVWEKGQAAMGASVGVTHTHKHKHMHTDTDKIKSRRRSESQAESGSSRNISKKKIKDDAGVPGGWGRRAQGVSGRGGCGFLACVRVRLCVCVCSDNNSKVR